MPEKRPKSAKNEHFYQKIRNIWKKLKKTVPFQKKSKKPKTVKIFEKAMRPKKGSAKTQKHETQEATGSERKRHGRRQGSGAEGDRKRTEAARKAAGNERKRRGAAGAARGSGREAAAGSDRKRPSDREAHGRLSANGKRNARAQAGPEPTGAGVEKTTPQHNETSRAGSKRAKRTAVSYLGMV